MFRTVHTDTQGTSFFLTFDGNNNKQGAMILSHAAGRNASKQMHIFIP
jgi:hypothetical protein